MNTLNKPAPTRPEWDTIRSRTIFFGHQSIGENILDGLRQLAAAEGWPPLDIVDLNSASRDSSILLHDQIGQNGDPASKLSGFRAALDAGAGAVADVALMKFCFWDIQQNTDVDAVFTAYQQMMDDVGRKYPAVTFVHTTVPLVVKDQDWRAGVRRLLGLTVPTDADNRARETLNEKIRRTYAGREPLFDIAALEQTSLDSGSFRYLAAGYSSDGAHLNEAGRRVVAAGFVKSLAAIPTGARVVRR